MAEWLLPESGQDTSTYGMAAACWLDPSRLRASCVGGGSNKCLTCHSNKCVDPDTIEAELTTGKPAGRWDTGFKPVSGERLQCRAVRCASHRAATKCPHGLRRSLDRIYASVKQLQYLDV